MYPKKYRINKPNEFFAIKQRGRRFSCPYFTTYLLKQETGNKSKIGFIVSNKEGSAVLRNSIKRQLRELFKDWLLVENIFWLVVIGKANIVHTSREEVEAFMVKAAHYYNIKLKTSETFENNS